MTIQKLKNFVNGKWVDPIDRNYIEVENPSKGEVISQSPLSSPADTEEAVAAAKAAFPQWAGTPVARRCEIMFQLTDIIRKNQEKISELICEEMGKSLPDARAEVKRVLENTEVACGTPILQQGDKLLGSSFDIDGEVIWQPRGVYAMIAPFNFPAMVPFWFLPYAIATGNTYIVKPSEQVPCTMSLMTEYIDQAGFPPGVFNLVHGDRIVSEAFIQSPDVQGISFVGTSSVCRQIAENCAKSNKRYQAMGSAKNHLVAMPDANMDEMIRNMITSCFGCAGQRCMAASAIVAVGDTMYETVCREFVEAAKKVTVADPLDPKVAAEPMVMGPVISAKAKRFIEEMIETGIKEGAKLALDGRGLKVEGCERGYFIGPTVLTEVQPGMEVHKTEIFGPVVVILRAGNLDEAIGIINDHRFGNGASIYTQSGYYGRKFKLETECGMIGINVGIPAPVAYLPFGGTKESQFAQIKGQGREIIDFFVEKKIITERYWPEV
jgi:malonate-semialdehyde dehydrogenase (acetylating)/methylmalonate-semialdehyde dehydrogenase